MPHRSPPKSTGAAVLGRALEIKRGSRAVEGARFILDLDIRSEDKARAADLLRRRQEGTLSPEELEELASYIEADDVLSILRAKALAVLKEAGGAPNGYE